MSAMCYPLFKCQLHQLLGRRTHILIPLSERNNGKSHALKVLYHLHSSPPVKCNLFDMKFCSQLINELLDKSIMDDIALGGLKTSLGCPYIIWDMIPSDTQPHVIFRYPEIRKYHIFFHIISWREHQHECRDIRRT